MQQKKIVVLTGAGISAESGLKTFRDSGGLWENHRVEDVASANAWNTNRKMLLDFYNLRRRAVIESEPNAGHRAIARLQQKFDVTVITQNVDDLHERAGSANVLHLHGEILKVRSTGNPANIYSWKTDLTEHDKCPEGYPLRPHIVWFGEPVPLFEKAAQLVSQGDILIITGTSMQVYPAASLVLYAPSQAGKYLVDPVIPDVPYIKNLTTISQKATTGLPRLVKQILNEL